MTFAYRRFSDVLPVAGLHDRSDESLDAAHLTHCHLVFRVVTRQIGENASSARDDVEVVRRQQLNQRAQQILNVVLQQNNNTP